MLDLSTPRKAIEEPRKAIEEPLLEEPDLPIEPAQPVNMPVHLSNVQFKRGTVDGVIFVYAAEEPDA